MLILALVALAIASIIGALAVGQIRKHDGGEGATSNTGALLLATNPDDLTPAQRECGQAILGDWAVDGIIDKSYDLECYAAALGLMVHPGSHMTILQDIRTAYDLRLTDTHQ